MHAYEVQPRRDKRGVDASSNAIRLVFLIETQPTEHGAPNRDSDMGGLGARRLSIFLRRVRFIRLMPLS